MSQITLAWDPLLAVEVLAGLALVSVALLALGALRRAPGLAWRTLAVAGLLAALANPAIVIDDREPLTDVAVVVVDESASQAIGARRPQSAAALAEVERQIGARDDVELRVVRVGPGGARAGAPPDGTLVYGALERAMADVPRGRFAGAILITDGQIHDVPETVPAAAFDGPVHALVAGARDGRDRRLAIVEAPSYGIVGQGARVVVRVDDPTTARRVRLTVRRNLGAAGESILAPVGVPHAITLPIDRGGANTYEITVAPGDAELTLANNRAIVVVNGVRDRLRVLLVSGEPHPGERTWRNLLKADPSVDLVHFTILRPPEKQDGTPVRELSLIAFPIRELFEIKLNEFDLVIFDRYRRRGVLPSLYLGNIADYVRGGGALLEAAGPSFASPLSLFRTPLARVLPGEPTGEVYRQPFHARLTGPGNRHPVTATLPGAAAPDTPDARPGWGRWFRQVEVAARRGHVVMTGAVDRPLLVLDRVGEGRVAQLMSDHIWLWARSFEGGGPHAELLRRLAHWLMKEPELEEETIAGTAAGDQLEITRQSLSEDGPPVTVTFPSGHKATVTLEDQGDGRATGSLAINEAGLYRLDDGTHAALAAVGALNPLEFDDVGATDAIVAPLAEATGGGIVWLAELAGAAAPELRRVGRDRTMAGQAAGGQRPWLGLQRNGAFVVRGIAELPLLAGLILLLAGLGALIAAWWREGR